MASKSAFIWVVIISTCPALIAYSSTGFLLPVWPDVFSCQKSAVSDQQKIHNQRNQEPGVSRKRQIFIEHQTSQTPKFRNPKCHRLSVSPCLRVYPLCPRMVLLMHLSEPLPRNMCIYLCSAYVGMTQHHLHRAQVCPTFEEMGSERVSQGVRSE